MLVKVTVWLWRESSLWSIASDIKQENKQCVCLPSHFLPVFNQKIKFIMLSSNVNVKHGFWCSYWNVCSTIPTKDFSVVGKLMVNIKDNLHHIRVYTCVTLLHDWFHVKHRRKNKLSRFQMTTYHAWYLLQQEKGCYWRQREKWIENVQCVVSKIKQLNILFKTWIDIFRRKK